jgi:hypothetical protein
VFQNTGTLTYTAAGAVLGMNSGDKAGMDTCALIYLHFYGKGLVNERAIAVADIATQAQVIETVFLIHQHSQPHSGLGADKELWV